MPDDPKASGAEAAALKPLAWRPLGAADRIDAGDSVEEALIDVRQKIYARSVVGWFARWRIALVVLTQALFYGLPWLNWNGRQAVLFDLGARKFYIFGMVLWPQDVIYLTLLLIISALGLFLFTAIAGRLFCGYACPQTVYTEIFMWIERRIEGDRIARIRLDESPLSLRKVRIKATKHLLWLAVAVWTGFSFIGYFAPVRGLMADLMAFALGPWQWFWLLFYSFATWGNAGFLREQVCKYMCPYARFQSVMVDRDTLVVTYDNERGEPRGSRSKKVDYKKQGLGDCVDCSICVQVCPTGIDIRQGLQYMCIGCGACVDACHEVMTKLEYPTGLIRYTSERALQEKLTTNGIRRHLFRPRVLIYSVLMLVLVTVFIGALATRTTLRVDVIRDRGMLGREVAGGLIENVYRLQMLNASEDSLHLTLSVEGASGLALKIVDGTVSSTTVEIPSASNRIIAVVVRAPIGAMSSGPHPIIFVTKSTTSEGKLLTEIREKSSFIIPN